MHALLVLVVVVVLTLGVDFDLSRLRVGKAAAVVVVEGGSLDVGVLLLLTADGPAAAFWPLVAFLVV